MILLSGNAAIFEEVTEDSLEVNDDDGVVKLVGPPLEVVAVCLLENFVCLRVQIHFNVILLELGLLARHGLL